MKLECWSSKMGRLRKKKMWGKKMVPYPLIKAMNITRLPIRLKTRLFPKGRIDGTVGLPCPY